MKIVPLVIPGNINEWDFVLNTLRRQAFKVLGKHVHPHMFRHSLCSYLLNNRNVSIAQVSKMLGHSSIKITQDSYAKVVQKKISLEIEKLKGSG